MPHLRLKPYCTCLTAMRKAPWSMNTLTGAHSLNTAPPIAPITRWKNGGQTLHSGNAELTNRLSDKERCDL